MDYFTNIVGQEKVVDYLKRVIDTKEFNHAYLFWGGAGIGKMQTALAFAYTAIAAADDEAHIYLNQMIHPDLKIVQILEGKTRISREQIIKDIEPWLSVRPYRAGHRIVIVRDAHLMTPEAANALLKTLEEPPACTIIILVADNNNILETIVSRCSLISFSSVTTGHVKQFLLERGYDEYQASSIALLAQGSVANALKLAEGEAFKELWSKAVNILQEIYKGEVDKVIETAQNLDDDSELLITTVETILRDLLVYAETKQESQLYFPDSLVLIRMVKNINYNKLKQAIKEIGAMKKYYNSNLNSLVLNINLCYKIRDAIKTS
ncbi:dna polymerase iii delta prime subunit [hydrocarbon metagenome]|uniref:Dna polymerase iii delta prime subunit n=1 Tax=hydrocarbon metagenome TaxID=938273 RepID=A0A0W8E8K4_9ZZZZ